MAIPEPEFKITVDQLERMLIELQYIPKDIDIHKRIERMHELRSKMFEHLDTVI